MILHSRNIPLENPRVKTFVQNPENTRAVHPTADSPTGEIHTAGKSTAGKPTAGKPTA